VKEYVRYTTDISVPVPSRATTSSLHEDLSVELKKIFLLYSYIGKISKNDRSKRTDKETNNDLHRKLNIEHHKPHKKTGVNSGAPEGKTVSSPLVVPSFYSSYTNPMITCE
jgi:hypothetical protein